LRNTRISACDVCNERSLQLKDPTGASADSGSTKPPDSCRSFWPNDDSNKKFVPCISDAFTKYAVVTAIACKDAETVADAIYRDWFSRFSIPAQIHMDGGKDFFNKLWADFFQLLNISHTKTSPAHPQCNAQVEIFNKTVKKFLQSFVDDTTLLSFHLLVRAKSSIFLMNTIAVMVLFDQKTLEFLIVRR
jgi:hypothetical protein